MILETGTPEQDWLVTHIDESPTKSSREDALLSLIKGFDLKLANALRRVEELEYTVQAYKDNGGTQFS